MTTTERPSLAQRSRRRLAGRIFQLLLNERKENIVGRKPFDGAECVSSEPAGGFVFVEMQGFAE